MNHYTTQGGITEVRKETSETGNGSGKVVVSELLKMITIPHSWKICVIAIHKITDNVVK